MKSALSLPHIFLPEDPLLRRIVIFVLSFHVLFLFLIAIEATLIPREKPRERMLIHTVSFTQPITANVPKIKPTSAPPSLPAIHPEPLPSIEENPLPLEQKVQKEKQPMVIPNAEPQAEKSKIEKKPAQVKKESGKKETVKKEAKKDKKVAKTQPKKDSAPSKKESVTSKKSEKSTKTTTPPLTNMKKETVLEAAKEKQQALLQKAKSSIAKLDRQYVALAESATATAPTLLKPLGKMQIDALPGPDSESILSDREVGYVDELVSRLKLLLRLPEYGEVKVKLTLERSGKVAKVVINGSKSEANRKYVEKTLPSLNFPSFGNNFSTESSYTFTLVLSNE